jgi:hypothetical protein
LSIFNPRDYNLVGIDLHVESLTRYEGLVTPPSHCIYKSGQGQAIVNGGFETGALAPWYGHLGTQSVVTTHPHSGTYCLKENLGGDNDLYQALYCYIPVDIILTFGCYMYPDDASNSPSFAVIYSDGSSDSNEFSFSAGSWHYANFIPFLTAHKYIKIVDLYNLGVAASYFDDVTLTV